MDSLTAVLLAQEAVRRLRRDGRGAEFIGVRLPYGVQADEQDAQASLEVIRPDRMVTVNIKSSADAMMSEVKRDAGFLTHKAEKISTWRVVSGGWSLALITLRKL